MNEEILIQKGKIEELIDIVTACHDDFTHNNLIYRFYENFSGHVKVFQQLNEAVKSKEMLRIIMTLKKSCTNYF